MKQMYKITVRSTGKVIGTFETLRAAEWFAYHNVYMPEQLSIERI